MHKVGDFLGNAVKKDYQVTQMPIVRVLQRPKKKDTPQPPPIQTNFDSAGGKAQKKGSSLQVVQPERSRINYQALTSKAQKAIAL